MGVCPVLQALLGQFEGFPILFAGVPRMLIVQLLGSTAQRYSNLL